MKEEYRTLAILVLYLALLDISAIIYLMDYDIKDSGYYTYSDNIEIKDENNDIIYIDNLEEGELLDDALAKTSESQGGKK